MAVVKPTRSLRALQDIPLWQLYPDIIELAWDRARKWGPPIVCRPRETCDKQCPEYSAHVEALHPTEKRSRRRRAYKYACSREWLRSLPEIGPDLFALLDAEEGEEEQAASEAGDSAV